ncbi:hypothetical protein EPUL_006679, partial [Erysiphe pulchra]
AHRDQETKEEIFLSACDEYASPDMRKGRVVGLRKDLNGWDLIRGKHAQNLKKKLDYLECLAQLHYYLREYGCRYGYILTDVNLIVVRHGIEETPHFGYLETKIFALNPSRRQSLEEDGELSECLAPQMRSGQVQDGPALLALWHLHMLALNMQVDGNVSWNIDTGSYSDKSRHRFLARDADLAIILESDVRCAERRKKWNAPWVVKAPRSKNQRRGQFASTQQKSQAPRQMACKRDPTRGIVKKYPGAVSKKAYKKRETYLKL